MNNVTRQFIKEEAIVCLGLSLMGLVFVLPVVWFVTVIVLDVNFSGYVIVGAIASSILLLPVLSLGNSLWEYWRGVHLVQLLHATSSAELPQIDSSVEKTGDPEPVETPELPNAIRAPKLGVISTVAVRGSHVEWPLGCTCCGCVATTYNEVTRTFKDSDWHAPIERVVKVSTTAHIPVCDTCLSHIQASSAFTTGAILAWPGAVAGMIVLGIMLTKFRSDLASLFGLPADRAAIPSAIVFLIFLVGAISVVRRILKHLDRAHEVSPDCTHTDGGVRFTGFVCPTEINPTLIETRHFTFRNLELRDRFLILNAKSALQVERPDDWEKP